MKYSGEMRNVRRTKESNHPSVGELTLQGRNAATGMYSSTCEKMSTCTQHTCSEAAHSKCNEKKARHERTDQKGNETRR